MCKVLKGKLYDLVISCNCHALQATACLVVQVDGRKQLCQHSRKKKLLIRGGSRGHCQRADANLCLEPPILQSRADCCTGEDREAAFFFLGVERMTADEKINWVKLQKQ